MQILVILLISIMASYAEYGDVDRSLAINGEQPKTRSVISPLEDKSEKRVALIIGNANYKGVLSKLSNTINDSRAMRDIVKSRGFDVIYIENGTKKEIKKSLDDFYNKLKDGGVGLLYFSGHGLEVDGKNYMIPIDAEIKAKSDTEYESICINKVTKRMQNIGNRLNIVILDACRNDPFSRAVGTGGLAKMEPIGLFVSYSTGAGSVSSDGRAGGHGLFTEYLIQNIKKPMGLQQVFQKTREQVYEASNHKQFPAIYNQIVRGDFYFTTPTSTKREEHKIEKVRVTTTKNKSVKEVEKEVKEQKVDKQEEYNTKKWNPKIFNGERSYSKNSENTVRDNYTNLIWTKDANMKANWNDAVKYCKQLSLDGYENWELPSKKELQYLSDTSKFAPTIDTQFFNVPRDITHHWTKTIFEADKSRAFGINFLAGGYDNYKKSTEGYVFCVSH